MNVAKTEQINELASALAKANMEIRNAELDRVNPHFKNRYATLGSILNAVRIPLAKQGLAAVQTVRMEQGCVYVTTILTHSSGQWIEESAGFPLPDKSTVQQMGSCITYLRRYTLAAICGIVGDEDDDGEGDRGTRTTATAQRSEAPRREAPRSEAPRQEAKAAPAVVDGEWTEITVKYVDEGVAGKNQTPYVKFKDGNGDNYFVWDEALHDLAASCKGKTVWCILEASKKEGAPPRIVQIRTSNPAAPKDADDVPF